MSLRSKSLILSLTLALSAVACSDDKEEAPPDAGNMPSFFDDAEVKDDGGDTTDPDAGTSDKDGEVAGDPNYATKAEADKEGWAEGCFKGKATTNEQLLNTCAKGFRTFDTKNYPASWKPDALPALP